MKPNDVLRLSRKYAKHFTKPRRKGPRVFVLGASKTGTHTLARMFEDKLRTGHEADAERLIRRFLRGKAAGDMSGLHQFLKWRDRFRNLKVDSSSVNVYLLDALQELYPDSQYILTARPPAVWTRSMLDHSVVRSASPTWEEFRKYRFGPGDNHPKEEAALAEAGLYPIASYLDYWRVSVGTALDQTPPDRLLVIPTEQIGDRVPEIAAVCGLTGKDAEPKMTHAYPNHFRSDLLKTMPRDYLATQIEATVGDLARRIWPDWSVEDDLDRALK